MHKKLLIPSLLYLLLCNNFTIPLGKCWGILPVLSSFRSVPARSQTCMEATSTFYMKGHQFQKSYPSQPFSALAKFHHLL